MNWALATTISIVTITICITIGCAFEEWCKMKKYNRVWKQDVEDLLKDILKGNNK